ncbi:MAG TPA: ATP-binding protein, partial [Pseudonocardiaceae bacterium]|nr:ATP-binding protein [Pseudonocardiaceae bacterium]
MREQESSIPSFERQCPATAHTVRELRVQFEQWLRDLGASFAVTHDLGLAVYEALANSAEHAYPPDHPTPTVELSAQLDGSHLTITVT